MSSSGAPLYPAKTIAKLFNLTERRVQQLAREGIIPKAERGKYELIGAVQGYVKYLQERSVGQHEASPTDLMEHKVRLTKAQASEKEIQVEMMKKNLIHVDDVVDTWGKIIGIAKSRLMALPRRLSSKLLSAADLRETEIIIKNGVVEVLEEISSVQDVFENAGVGNED